MQVTISDRQYNFNFTNWWGALYRFEEIMDVANHPERKFSPFITFHMHVLWYAILLCDNDALDLTLDDFISSLDDMRLHGAMRDYYDRRLAILFPAADRAGDAGSKKKS